MTRVVDITDKLNFEENPKLKIKDTTIEVNADAQSMLKIMQLIGNGEDMSPDRLVIMYELIFGENERKKVDKLSLNMTDFQIVVKAAINLVTGENVEKE